MEKTHLVQSKNPVPFLQDEAVLQVPVPNMPVDHQLAPILEQ
jgi:hypothetical protein